MVFRKRFVASGLLVLVLVFGVKSDAQCDVDVENTLRTLLAPPEQFSLQVQALRRELLKRLQDALEQQEEEALLEYKRWDGGKRNLEALARGGYIKTQQEQDGEDQNLKRSYAHLVKNGGLPLYTTNSADTEKRGIQSLARNGELHRRNEDFLDEYDDGVNSNSQNLYYYSPYGKRYLGSLAQSGDLRQNGKRSVASLAREGIKVSGKRNVAALLRQDKYLLNKQDDNFRTDRPGDDYEKRNIASIKSKLKRKKRDAGYYEPEEEYAIPVYQNQNVYDYEELMKAITGSYPPTDKRFLGSVAKTGWYRTPSSETFRSNPEKRHIGALARIGWLPSFRTARRFNRSGRSAVYNDASCRETSSNGKTADDGASQESVSLEGKRFLLQPAVDNILLRRIFYHPKSH